ncbi:hypothetical protein [Photobacterium kishitanii]|uniref:Uncharacterized protein n=1 Tax=Photobacterium kishitanii TaxID=318456 RepID=A0A2T3KLR5_9GAMM|nr:hypothetical protein [Photobacterium kishitanii]PSV00616.1 hypothetical protein C9J27_05625 [Photobacterium kishitanii]
MKNKTDAKQMVIALQNLFNQQGKIDTNDIVELSKRPSCEKSHGFTSHFKKPIISDKTVFLIIEKTESVGVSILKGKASLTYQNRDKNTAFRSTPIDKEIFSDMFYHVIENSSKLSIQNLIDFFSFSDIESLPDDLKQKAEEEIKQGDIVLNKTKKLFEAQETMLNDFVKDSLTAISLTKRKNTLVGLQIKDTDEYKLVSKLEVQLQEAKTQLNKKKIEIDKNLSKINKVALDTSIYEESEKFKQQLVPLLSLADTISTCDNYEFDAIVAKTEVIRICENLCNFTASATKGLYYPDEWGVKMIIARADTHNTFSPVELMFKDQI